MDASASFALVGAAGKAAYRWGSTRPAAFCFALAAVWAASLSLAWAIGLFTGS